MPYGVLSTFEHLMLKSFLSERRVRSKVPSAFIKMSYWLLDGLAALNPSGACENVHHKVKSFLPRVIILQSMLGGFYSLILVHTKLQDYKMLDYK